jgi:hypothetical protein
MPSPDHSSFSSQLFIIASITPPALAIILTSIPPAASIVSISLPVLSPMLSIFKALLLFLSSFYFPPTV